MKEAIDLCKPIEQFGSEERCREYLEQLRWPDAKSCLKCKSEKVYPILGRNQYVCDSCTYQFSVTAGTIFHDTHLPFWKWFLATYLLCESRKGMSANQIKRTLGISYKTAWYLCHRIRAAMAEADGHKLSGAVKIDEAYMGGKRRGHGGQLRNNSAVISIRERGGHLHFIRAENLNQDSLYKIIQSNVDTSVDVTMTDESKLYNFKISKFRDVKHKSVDHSQDEYVRREKGMVVTTNTVESAFSLLKCGIVGPWHRVSRKHLAAYLHEMTWRFNNRKNPFLFRDTIKKLIASGNLEYKDLIKAA